MKFNLAFTAVGILALTAYSSALTTPSISFGPTLPSAPISQPTITTIPSTTTTTSPSTPSTTTDLPTTASISTAATDYSGSAASAVDVTTKTDKVPEETPVSTDGSSDGDDDGYSSSAGGFEVYSVANLMSLSVAMIVGMLMV